jgi:hypothetical protein
MKQGDYNKAVLNLSECNSDMALDKFLYQLEQRSWEQNEIEKLQRFVLTKRITMRIYNEMIESNKQFKGGKNVETKQKQQNEQQPRSTNDNKEHNKNRRIQTVCTKQFYEELRSKRTKSYRKPNR